MSTANAAPHAVMDGEPTGTGAVLVAGNGEGVAEDFPFGEGVAPADGVGDAVGAPVGDAVGEAVSEAVGTAVPTSATTPAPLVTRTQVSFAGVGLSLKTRTSSGAVLPTRYPCGPL
jgi:hypothetical protein